MLPARKVPFADARRRRHGGGAPRKGFDPNQPRGGDGRWIYTGQRLREAAGAAGQNVALHVPFGPVRRPASLGKLVGVDVKGFRHAASNQAMAHAIREHGNPVMELARGQKPIGPADFERLPMIVRTGKYKLGPQRAFGPPRVEVHAEIDGDRYVYVGEVRRGKRRVDMVTMWKR